MLSLPMNPMKPLNQLFPTHSENHQALDLVVKMLEFHPLHRISTEKAIEHPFLQSLHNADEPVADFTFTFDFENEELGKERIQELMWEEMRTYHPEIDEVFPSASRRKSRTLHENESKAESKSFPDSNVERISKGSLKRAIGSEENVGSVDVLYKKRA